MLDNMKMYLYIDESDCINIKMGLIVKIDILKKESLYELNNQYQILRDKMLTIKEYALPWYVTVIIVVEKKSQVFMDMLSENVFQREGLYRLPVGICLENEEVLIGIQDDIYKKDKYYEMKKAVLTFLEIT